MSQSSTAHFQAPNPMKKKIISALVAVIIGHTAVLWAVSHIQTPELKKIDKPPLQVRFVKLNQQTPPPPKAEPQPKKEPVERKQVKVVNKPVETPPPKKVEKVQQVKAVTPKPVITPVNTPKVTETVKTTVVTEKPVEKPTAPVEPAKPTEPAKPVDHGPKHVSLGKGVSWSFSPKPNVNGLKSKHPDLTGRAYQATFRVYADEKGRVTNVVLRKSSGSDVVDAEIERSVKNARFKPYKEGGVAYPILIDQPFSIQL